MISLQNSKLFSEGKEVGIEALKTEITKKPLDSYTSLPAASFPSIYRKKWHLLWAEEMEGNKDPRCSCIHRTFLFWHAT